MKALVASFVFTVCQWSFAAENTNIIAMSEWSKPVSLRNQHLHDIPIRGRLLIVQGMEPAYGGATTTNGVMTFVELQNVAGACCDGIDVYFAVMDLHCELVDAKGKAVPKPGGGWSGRGPFSPCWLHLPYNSTIRLFVSGGSMEPLSVAGGGQPWDRWSIRGNDTNTYFLSGTLNLSTHTNTSLPPQVVEMEHRRTGMAALEFPKITITGRRMDNAQRSQ